MKRHITHTSPQIERRFEGELTLSAILRNNPYLSNYATISTKRPPQLISTGKGWISMDIPHYLQKIIEENKKAMQKLHPEARLIRFYETDKPYGCFSNFAKYPIVLQNKKWPTAEHYFQAQKFAGTAYEEEIRLAGTPTEAASFGRDRHNPLRPDWEARKLDTMREALIAKFYQHPVLAAILRSTGDCTLTVRLLNIRLMTFIGETEAMVMAITC